MPASRTRAAPAEAAATPAPEEDGGPVLHFDEPLTWRAGKAIPVADLTRRLKSLFSEIKAMDQEDVSPPSDDPESPPSALRISLVPVAKELAHPNLLGHKDRGVRAWTACCVVEMFRLCAPDAPYNASQLKEIFTLVVGTIVPALADPSNAYNTQHLYVLTSLTSVKSIVLLTDILDANDLILRLFVTCFDVLSGSSRLDTGEELSKNVEYHMTGMLVTLVDECAGLPTKVVDIILAQFLRADPKVVTSGSAKGKKNEAIDERQQTLSLKQLPPAYNMAKNICNSCPDKLARSISQYFSSVIMETSDSYSSRASKKRPRPHASSDVDEDDDLALHGPSGEDLREIHKAHRLLRELWRSTPTVLQNIVPQLETELSADNVQLRILGTETVGDLVSGIGAAGPPPPSVLDPSAYPSHSVVPPTTDSANYNFLTTPFSPHAFYSMHASAYHNFLNRRNDRSPLIRTVWATSVGRILMTSAGGVGLDPGEETKLLKWFAEMLVDGDDRVRLAAVQAVAKFSFKDLVGKLGADGGVATNLSVLGNLADRIKDKKHQIRVEAMELLGRIWGVASGAISEGHERISELLGPIPSKILACVYVNDLEINALVDRVMFESLLPLGYPPVKSKGNVKDRQTNGNGAHDTAAAALDVDKIRTERILLLVRNLEPKAKTVFFAIQSRQASAAKYLDAFIMRCEQWNGGVAEKETKDAKEAQQNLKKLIEFLSKALPEPAKAADNLWKFAKTHDRRAYQLVRFCLAAGSDYKKVYKALREFTKRLEEAPASTAISLDALIPLLYRSSVLVYNKSHVPAIMEFSRTDEKNFGAIAHEVLKEISTNNPEVFRAHVQELCKGLETQAPTAESANDPGAVDTLKACAGFATKFPAEVPKDRKFLHAMVNYAVHGTPPKAAKHAVSVIMAVADKKEMFAKDILHKCTSEFQYGADGFLSKLAALSQLMLLASKELEEEADGVINIAIEHVLLRANASFSANDDDVQEAEVEWQEEPDSDLQAKIWALKTLVNRLRSSSDDDSVKETAKPVYKLLNKLVAKDGQLSKKSDDAIPKAHKARLRLLAAQLFLKLCATHKVFDDLLTPADFNVLATVVQDPNLKVRVTFVNSLKKGLGQNKLPRRFYTPIFLLAFEPLKDVKESTATWLRARSQAFQKTKDTAMESMFARLLSLLAHHPDFSSDHEDLQDFIHYILFYLKAVATEENLPLIYHVAQRVKAVRDGVDPPQSENLYILSDLAQAVMRRFEEEKGWSMQAWPGKLRMPAALFAPLPSHEVAQQIADKQYVPEDLIDKLEGLVSESLKTKKRRLGEVGAHRATKKVKSVNGSGHGTLSTKKVAGSKTPKTPRARKGRRVREGGISSAAPSSERRRSGRARGKTSYAERDDSEDDAEMEAAGGHAEEEDDHMDGEDAAELSEASDMGTPTAKPKPNGKTKAVAIKEPRKKTNKVVAIPSDDSEGDLSDPPDTEDEA
ncbi:hypothetical protein B0A49_12339 [Cryomyces minteri]|uniref:Uncharacterized protein n=1 Tax=Cryomyces minteri TaxID=331657 RepID=A0A4U0XNJ7_9PEZI|nr:hypothetical protein B0A49_12339 [Cryomyces minteri]